MSLDVRSIFRLTASSLLVALCSSFAVAGEPGAGARLPVGYPDRSGETDILRGFKDPPPGYGDVAFYWWLGDTLTHERILWQMDQLAGRGVTGLQVNYAHTDTGGYSYGRTMRSAPPLFSDAWWELFRWFLGEARKRGMSVSLSDYTLGRAGQGWYVDEMLSGNPGLAGSKLACVDTVVHGGTVFTAEVPPGLLLAVAYRKDGDTLVTASRTGLGDSMKQNHVSWSVPPGVWRVLFIHREHVPASLDPMHPLAGKEYVAHFFQRFEDHCPGEAGKGLNFFFSDELDFGIRGWLWDDIFAAEFLKRKGYDVLPELGALFADCGPRTPKVRLDYSDVMVALSEEHFFKPLYDWHTERGMLFGCDHGGRGTDVTEFGDYFRAQRWMSGPGCDQPDLARDIVKNKVASSIAHLYERPRTWLEGYHSSGWGTSSAQVADATFANFGMGQNLLSLHGLYYSTHGSWWEWAPPDNHFRQPYWAEMPGFLHCVERLSYVLSQGVHRCDVAVLYPVAPMEAGIGGDAAVTMAFTAMRGLYTAGIDADFIDFESVARADVAQGELRVAGERYKVLVLPALAAVRYAMMEKIQSFASSGGTVIALGALPGASDRAGRQDAELDRIVRGLFGRSAARTADSTAASSTARGIVLPDAAGLAREVTRSVPRDIQWEPVAGQSVEVLHRSIGKRDVYYVYGAKQGTELTFRMRGKVELWDPWTGTVRPVPVRSSDANGTRLLAPLTETEPQLFVFSPGTPSVAPRANRDLKSTQIPLDGEWQMKIVPTLDNQWGDYRLPAFAESLGVEVSTMLYKEERGAKAVWQLPWLTEDSTWRPVAVSFGPQFMKLGPMPRDAKAIALRFAQVGTMDPADSIEVGGRAYGWTPYEFSWRWGLKDNTGHQGYHGLKGFVHDDQIQLGRAVKAWRGVPAPQYEQEGDGRVAYLWSTVRAARAGWGTIRRHGIAPTAVWVNNERLDTSAQRCRLFRGVNTILLRYEGTGVGAYVIDTAAATQPSPLRVPMASVWYTAPGVMRFDVQPDPSPAIGWYRFAVPAGVRSLRFAAYGAPRVWVDGVLAPLERDSVASPRFPASGASVWRAVLPAPITHATVAALRVEMTAGCYGGAAIPEPVVVHCDSGMVTLKDLAGDRALGTYSGGLLYTKTVVLTRAQAGKKIILDLGALTSSARVFVNGSPAGEHAAPPWVFDLSGKLKVGTNRIEVLVHTTLGNHYRAVPSGYPGRDRSGLVGPVVLRVEG